MVAVAVGPSAIGRTPAGPRHAGLVAPFSVRSFGVAQKAQLATGVVMGPAGVAASTVYVVAVPGGASAGSPRTARMRRLPMCESRSPKSGLHAASSATTSSVRFIVRS